MLAYNKQELDNGHHREMTEEAAALGLITESEKTNVLSTFPSRFFSPNTIVRIGLGFATAVALTTFITLVYLVLDLSDGESVISFLFGAGCITLLEYMIRVKYHFRSGIDDVLLYLAFIFLMATVFDLLDRAPNPSVPISFIACLLAVAGSIRYADRLMTGLSLLVFILFIYYLLIKINAELWLAMPLISLVICAATWYAAVKMQNQTRFKYYRNCFEFLQITCLIVAGLCSNYYMITENWFKSHYYQQQMDDTWKAFYIAVNIIVPMLVIVSGFRVKDKKRIRTGTLMIVAALATFHYYITDTPSEVLCIMYGAVLLVVSYWLLKHHRPKENGISFSEKQDGRDLFEMESLLVGAGVSLVIPQQAADRFGGGHFGGAGAEGEY